MFNNVFQKIVFLLLLIITFQLSYCKRKKTIDGFDSDRWAEDVNGCESTRVDMMGDLLKVKFKMRGKKMADIEDILGPPDGIELYKRDQKYYIYYMEPGPSCNPSKDNPLKLYVRFTAVGIANEISVKN